MDHPEQVATDPGDETAPREAHGEDEIRALVASSFRTLDPGLSPGARCALFLQAAADALRDACGDEAVDEGLASLDSPHPVPPGPVSASEADADGRAEWIAWRRGLLIGFLGSMALAVPFAIAMFALEVVVLNPAMP